MLQNSPQTYNVSKGGKWGKKAVSSSHLRTLPYGMQREAKVNDLEGMC